MIKREQSNNYFEMCIENTFKQSIKLSNLWNVWSKPGNQTHTHSLTSELCEPRSDFLAWLRAGKVLR